MKRNFYVESSCALYFYQSKCFVGSVSVYLQLVTYNEVVAITNVKWENCHDIAVCTIKFHPYNQLSALCVFACGCGIFLAILIAALNLQHQLDTV